MANNQYVNRYSTRYSSKRHGRSSPPAGLIAAIVLIIVIAVVVVVAAITAKRPSEPTTAPETETAGTSTSSETKPTSSDPTIPAEPTEPADPTTPAEPTKPADPTTEPEPTKPSDPTTDPEPIVPGDVLPLPEGIDRGYLADLGKLDDGSPANSWYFAALDHVDGNGVPTFKWDRYKSTLDLFDKYGAIYRKDMTKKIVYLTFDCGYEYGKTTRILDTLKAKGVQAVFFCSGEFVSDPNNKELLLRMVNEGHLIGNHTDIHPKDISMTLTDAEFANQLITVNNKVDALLGYHYDMKFYRPPEGAVNERDLCLAKRLGYTTVLWSFAYGDYTVTAQPDPVWALENAESKLYNGCVYLLHAVSETNATILGDLIDYMHGQGYEIKRLDK